ncbi:HAMP domain-containing histidine kinase [Kribbella sp. NBC_01245]|uniref:sensor histidine kinase n=1 Tax=Kribbella sp. NBC_01245 TaxID=2903578 RepID=UPI002E2D6800|nr:HAMP domain-containing sensor histidine kinase [Kribbella sp. NBC_01245]
MRRSVLLRFLTLSLAVALGAVIATALIATYSTSEKLQGEIDQSGTQLDADGRIYGDLLAYAADHSDWSSVGTLVGQLANETGRRIAVTTADGKVIADSARTLGTAPELPSRPAAALDILEQPQLTVSAAAGGSIMRRAVPAVGANGSVIFSAGSTIGSPYWRMTEAERQHRKAIGTAAVGCLRANSHDAELIEGPSGVPEVGVRTPVNETSSEFTYVGGGDPQFAACVPQELSAASAAALTLNTEEVARATACLQARNERYDQVPNPTGLTELVPPQSEDPSASKVSEGFQACTSEARATTYKPYVAPRAQLFLGEANRFNVFSGEGLLRTTATALGVLLIASLVMVFAGRRLVRPIVALTGAAQQMASGHRGARVPVSGTDEVARLGHAFNAMAASIEQHDHQRKAMVSDVAHELRTPLANIKGYLVASEDGVVPLDGALVGSLLEEADLLERLVVDLQDLALADAGMLRLHRERRDLADLAQQVVAAHRPKAEAAEVVLTASAEGPVFATVDGARIRQAIGNLVSNALRFTPAGGRVTVSVRTSGGRATIDVTDTGTGIAPEHLPRLFDRFYRVDESRSRETGGSGLGLAITKHLIEAHHGRIGVTSTPNTGSTFTLELPYPGQAG